MVQQQGVWVDFEVSKNFFEGNNFVLSNKLPMFSDRKSLGCEVSYWSFEMRREKTNLLKCRKLNSNFLLALKCLLHWQLCLLLPLWVFGNMEIHDDRAPSRGVLLFNLFARTWGAMWSALDLEVIVLKSTVLYLLNYTDIIHWAFGRASLILYS